MSSERFLSRLNVGPVECSECVHKQCEECRSTSALLLSKAAYILISDLIACLPSLDHLRS